jgi:hypothetical protein
MKLGEIDLRRLREVGTVTGPAKALHRATIAAVGSLAGPEFVAEGFDLRRALASGFIAGGIFISAKGVDFIGEGVQL